MPPSPSTERGQASVELVALLPLLAVLAVLAGQLVVAGQAVWLAGTAARAAARARALGHDATAGARAALPPGYRRGLRVRTTGPGRVSVRLRVPVLAGGRSLGFVVRDAGFRPQGPS